MTAVGGIWTQSVVYAFTGDGMAAPYGNLVFDTNGAIHGTTASFVNSGSSLVSGTAFQLTPPVFPSKLWTAAILFTFPPEIADTQPMQPTNGGLVIDSNGVLYGSLSATPGGYGSLFELTSSSGIWTETVLYNFTDGHDGAYPSALALGKNGVLYGTTAQGGIIKDCSNASMFYGCGTVFRLKP